MGGGGGTDDLLGFGNDDDLLGGNVPSKPEPKSQNAFAFINSGQSVAQKKTSPQPQSNDPFSFINSSKPKTDDLLGLGSN